MMTWTRTAPTDGWWWHRSNGQQESIVLVYTGPDGIQYMCGPEVDHCRMDEITDDEDCEYSESEWSSTPIARPGEVKDGA
jgi:hypothetical protein